MLTTDYPHGHPMIAQPALQQCKLVGRNRSNMVAGKLLQAFSYDDKGSRATIGRNRAVADLKVLGKEYRIQGLVAWFIWMFIHLILVIGFRNRLIVLISWMWGYLSYDKGIRLILGKKKENVPVEAVTPKAGV